MYNAQGLEFKFPEAMQIQMEQQWQAALTPVALRWDGMGWETKKSQEGRRPSTYSNKQPKSKLDSVKVEGKYWYSDLS